MPAYGNAAVAAWRRRTGARRRGKSIYLARYKRSAKMAGPRNLQPQFASRCKALDTSLVDTALDTAKTSFQLLNGIAEGSAYGQRVGRKIKMNKLLLRLQIDIVPGTVTQGKGIRVTIVYDSQTNKTKPIVGDIFATVSGTTTNPASTTTTPTSVKAYENPDNRDRFKILYDKTQNLNPNTGTNEDLVPVGKLWINKFLNLRGLETIFCTNGATEGDISTGALWLIVQTDLVHSSETTVQFAGTSRLFLNDKC